MPVDGGRSGHAAAEDVDPAVLITPSGITMPLVEDLGTGRGPGWLDRWLTVNTPDVLAWFRHIHANPELSRQEYATTELIAGLLKSFGLQPELLPGGTGLICDVGEGERCVALRADMDALPMNEASGLPYATATPGACHACGHDAHTTILLATGIALASAPELPGRVRLIFQPAEE
ncbi:MAG: M20/M25/M40 family metallo-hydrolase, partial [Actinomycetota bacterium]|nr:M20/M25/M40 family metallo-hydrolase [Actinomycetota bacterium]